MTPRQGCAVLAVLIAGVARAQGIESNFRPYLVGGRAAGMGGAFTALADDGSGGYYNPGGSWYQNNYQEIRNAQVQASARGRGDRDQIWKLIDEDERAVREVMLKKYNVDFAYPYKAKQ